MRQLPGNLSNRACLYFNKPCAVPFPIFGSDDLCPDATPEEIEACEDVWGPGAWDETFCMCRNPNTPIVVDLQGNGFQLTSAEEGVLFDFNGDGIPEPTGWTEGSKDDAFLVLDRNRNGMIDDGSELLGNWTPQPASDSLNGFATLEQYDAADEGGNQDGRISARDAIYARLALWVDRNHDGRSQLRELFRLSDSNFSAIDLSYHESRRSDEYGNIFRFSSWARKGNGTRVPVVDVFFAGRRMSGRQCRAR